MAENPYRYENNPYLYKLDFDIASDLLRKEIKKGNSADMIKMLQLEAVLELEYENEKYNSMGEDL